MAYLRKPTKHVEEVFVNVIREIAEEQNATDGIIEIKHTDVIERSNGEIRNSPTVSGTFHYFVEKGKVTRLQKGTASRPTKWDVSGLLEEKPKKSPSIQVEVRKEEPAVIKTEVVHEVQSTLKDILGYIQALPTELTGSINQLNDKVSKLDDNKIEALRKELRASEERNLSLQQEIKRLKEELQKTAEQVAESAPRYNEHKIVRARNRILDEVERYLAYPGWKRKSSDDHFRMTIDTHLNTILQELDIREPIA